MFGTQLNHLAGLAKCLRVCFRTKWLLVRVQLQSLKLHISRLLSISSSLTFRQLWSADSLWSAYLTLPENTVKCTVHICTRNIAQSFDQFGPNGWLFIYELRGSTFQSTCNHLNFRFRACIEQEFPRHSGSYRVCIHSETRTWLDQNMQSNAS